MTHPLMKLPAGYDAWRTRGPDYDDYECTECGGNHVEERGWYDCECCDGLGEVLGDDARPLPVVCAFIVRGIYLAWARRHRIALSWDGWDVCETCEGEGRLQCETCERNYWETKR